MAACIGVALHGARGCGEPGAGAGGCLAGAAGGQHSDGRDEARHGAGSLVQHVHAQALLLTVRLSTQSGESLLNIALRKQPRPCDSDEGRKVESRPHVSF